MEESEAPRHEWRHVPGTSSHNLLDVASDKILRQIEMRPPDPGEPGGPKFVVTGDGYEPSVHESLDKAISAAEASLG